MQETKETYVGSILVENNLEKGMEPIPVFSL